MSRISKIMLATDFSDNAEAARRLAQTLSRDLGARLLIVHVEPGDLVDGSLIGGRDDSKARMRFLADRLRDVFADEVEAGAQTLVRVGDPTDEILAVIDLEQVDMVVLGTTGRNGLGRVVFGSVAEAVARQAHCPVLTVRGRLNPRTDLTHPLLSGTC